MALDVYSTLNSDAGVSEKFFRSVAVDGTGAAQHGSEADIAVFEAASHTDPPDSPPNVIQCVVEVGLLLPNQDPTKSPEHAPACEATQAERASAKRSVAFGRVESG